MPGLLERCSREEVTGISLFEIVNEATHVFMLAEARSKGLIAKNSASTLRQNFSAIPPLVEYWRETERILALLTQLHHVRIFGWGELQPLARRQMPSRYLRRRLELLSELYPPPKGYAVLPEQVKKR